MAAVEKPRMEPWLDGRLAISTLEREVIQDYVNRHNAAHGRKVKSLPPGLARKPVRQNQLPSGWESDCVRGETLPKPIIERFWPLPKDLAIKLPPTPKGTVTITLEGKIVRLWEETRQVVDVFEIRL